MKYIFLMLIVALLSACVPEENCTYTDEVYYYKTEETKYYTVTIPVYKKVCQ